MIWLPLIWSDTSICHTLTFICLIYPDNLFNLWSGGDPDNMLFLRVSGHAFLHYAKIYIPDSIMPAGIYSLSMYLSNISSNSYSCLRPVYNRPKAIAHICRSIILVQKPLRHIRKILTTIYLAISSRTIYRVLHARSVYVLFQKGTGLNIREKRNTEKWNRKSL